MNIPGTAAALYRQLIMSLMIKMLPPDIQLQILRSVLCLQFFWPVMDHEAKQSFDAVSLSILVLSVAHKAKNL